MTDFLGGTHNHKYRLSTREKLHVSAHFRHGTQPKYLPSKPVQRASKTFSTSSSTRGNRLDYYLESPTIKQGQISVSDIFSYNDETFNIEDFGCYPQILTPKSSIQKDQTHKC